MVLLDLQWKKLHSVIIGAASDDRHGTFSKRKGEVKLVCVEERKTLECVGLSAHLLCAEA